MRKEQFWKTINKIILLLVVVFLIIVFSSWAKDQYPKPRTRSLYAGQENAPIVVESVIEKRVFVLITMDNINEIIDIENTEHFKFFYDHVRNTFKKNKDKDKDPVITRMTVLNIVSEARKNDIPITLAFALADWESRFNLLAVNENGKSKDVGYYQLNTNTFIRGLKMVKTEKELFDIETNIALGLWYLADKHKFYNNWVKAIMVYNDGNLRNGINSITINHLVNVLMIEEELRKEFCETIGITF